jgi:hypothetical protein
MTTKGKKKISAEKWVSKFPPGHTSFGMVNLLIYLPICLVMGSACKIGLDAFNAPASPFL